MKTLQALLLSLLSLILASCSNEAKDPKEAADSYRVEFGTLPPPAVSSIQAKQVVVGDAVRGWLRFNTDKATLAALLTAKSFIPATWEEFSEATGGANIPAWWTPDKRMTFYKREKWEKSLLQSDAYIAHDEQAGTVYFCHSGSD